MDLDRLAEFLIIAEEGSFKKAAQRMGLAPNVLSTRFAAFENTLQLKLIERNARRFTLTESGALLLQNAKGLLGSYDKILSDLQAVQGTSFKSLRLQLCAQTMATELGPFLDRYCRRYPMLFLDLYDENNCTIQEGLRSGEVDISFAVGREGDFADVPGRIALNSFPKMKVHVPNDHLLAIEKSIRFDQLAGETFILYPRMLETCTHDLQRSMLEQAGIPYQIYEANYSPFFYDLLVPIGKGIRLWNWTDRPTPNSSLLTLQDEGFETYLYLLYDPKTRNDTTIHFIDSFTQFRKERK